MIKQIFIFSVFTLPYKYYQFPINQAKEKGTCVIVRVSFLISAVEASHLLIISSEGYVAKI